MSRLLVYQLDFLMLVVTSLLLPVGIFLFLLRTRAIARLMVLAFAAVLILLSAVDVFLLRTLSQLVKETASLMDDRLFNSEISVALYVLPAAFAGIGVNLISHLVIEHLQDAERRFDRRHPRPPDRRSSDRRRPCEAGIVPPY